jgi:hypothetical protein
MKSDLKLAHLLAQISRADENERAQKIKPLLLRLPQRATQRLP